MATGWEILQQGIAWGGFDLIQPVGLLLTVILSIAITQNTKKALIISFPMSLALTSAGVNPGILVHTATGLAFLFGGMSLTTIGSILSSTTQGVREVFLDRRDDENLYALDESRRQERQRWTWEEQDKRKRAEKEARGHGAAIKIAKNEKESWLENLLLNDFATNKK